MDHPVISITKAATITISPTGVRITIFSDEDIQAYEFSRYSPRRLIEEGARVLDAAEAADKAAIIAGKFETNGNH
jgi:hypothetical protein